MKHIPILGIFLCSVTAGFAQNLLGISTSRYGGTNRLYINPALAADSPSKFYLNVMGGSGHVDNNYVRYQAPYSLLRLITGNVPNQYKNANGSVQFETDYTRETLNGRPKNVTVAGEVRGPSFLMRTGERGAFAVTTRLRAVAQGINASEPLLSAVRANLTNGSIPFIPANNNTFSANTNTYAELGLTYAGTLLEGNGRRLMVGATAKFLMGYNAQYLINQGMNYKITQDPKNPNTGYLEVTKLDAQLAYTTFLDNRNLTPFTLFSPSAPGRGFGVDVGLTYVDQYDEDSPRSQIGIALTDIGGLTYTGQAYSYTNIGQNPIRFSPSDFNNLSGTSSIIRVIKNKLSEGRTPDATSFKTGLPTSLNLTADYQLPSGFGINLTYLQDVRSSQAISIHQPSLVALTPRFDSRLLSLAVPMAYLNGGFTAGASVRVGPGWVGSDNLLGLLGNRSNGIQPRGLDVYAGLAFSLGRDDER